MQRLDSASADFEARFEALIDSDTPAQAEIDSRVAAIIADVRERGDEAVVAYTRELDRHPATDMAALEIAPARLSAALEAMPAQPRAALETAADRIRRYAESQKIEAQSYEDELMRFFKSIKKK